MNCKNTRGCCSPCSALAQQLEETNTRAVAAYNLAQSALDDAMRSLKNPVTSDLTINAKLIVNGDIIQNGSAYETHAEKVYTNDDYIVMREGAISALAPGTYSGFQVTKYDGSDDGRLVIDGDGIARVGDVADEQPLLTRRETVDLVDGAFLKWDATYQRAYTNDNPIAHILAASIQRSGSAFTSSVSYTDYPYECTIPWTDLNPQDVPGFDDPMTAIVTFSPSNDDNSIYAPFCEIDASGLTIYANDEPTLCGFVVAIIGSGIE